jgi:hypothetical protein
VEFLRIFHRPKEFPLTLNQGENIIEIRAANEGIEPPNTASIWVVTPNGEFQQRFRANQYARDRFVITLK